MTAPNADDRQTDLDPEVDTPDVTGERPETEETPTDESDHDADEAQRAPEWEKRYKDAQSHITKIEQENKELRSKFDVLTGRFDEVARAKEPALEPEKDPLDDPELESALRDDPSLVRTIIRGERQKFVQLLELRDRAMMAQMRSLSPDEPGVTRVMAELKKDPDFAGWPPEALRILARKQLANGEEEEEEVRPSGGEQSFSGRPLARKKRTKESPEAAAWYKRLGYDRYDKEE